MRKVDSSIELVAVGCEDPEWNLEMVKKAEEYFDYLSVHIYIRGAKSYRELAAVPVDIERRLRNVYGLVESARRRYSVKRKSQRKRSSPLSILHPHPPRGRRRGAHGSTS